MSNSFRAVTFLWHSFFFFFFPLTLLLLYESFQLPCRDFIFSAAFGYAKGCNWILVYTYLLDQVAVVIIEHGRGQREPMVSPTRNYTLNTALVNDAYRSCFL